MTTLIMKPPPLSPAALAQQVELAKASPQAFEPVYQSLYPEVYRFLMRRTGDEALAADLAQETFIAALTKLRQWKDRGVSVLFWLLAIARNEANSHCRRAKRAPVVYVSPDEVAAAARHLWEPGPDPALAERRANALLQALGTLKEHDRELIRLRFFEGMALNEIAVVLDLSPENTRVRLHRALSSLRTYLKANHFNEIGQ